MAAGSAACFLRIPARRFRRPLLRAGPFEQVEEAVLVFRKHVEAVELLFEKVGAGAVFGGLVEQLLEMLAVGGFKRCYCS